MRLVVTIAIILLGLISCTEIPPRPSNNAHVHYTSGKDCFLYTKSNGDSIFGPTYSIYFPRSFAPQKEIGQLANNYFYPIGQGFIDGEFKIFNRLGQKLYETTFINGDLDPNNTRYTKIGWDGKYKGKLMPAGVYEFTCTFKTPDGEQKRLEGTFNLIL